MPSERKEGAQSVATVVERVVGTATPMHGSDIDTDRIIPARYLKVTRFDGLGEYAFYDERHDQNGKPIAAHPLNDTRYKNSKFLVVENNFGCGSSREHAPQSLMRFGYRAFIGVSFAEIFHGNCLALGLPVVTLPPEDITAILKTIEDNPTTPLELNMKHEQEVHEGEEETLRVSLKVGDTTYRAWQARGAHQLLLTGTWDSTSLLLQNQTEILRVAGTLPYIHNFAKPEQRTLDDA